MNNINKIKTFQEIIERLNSFWQKKGCIIAQPYGLEVGAGTANPQTFFRALGPEPYNVAYVEPSRRPDDGRYGENPNRLQHYFQYQVILKPAPKNNQELYIEMLKEIGIDPKKHDLRFVEDNWESPAIGAWGLGWEVWLDGMEISQYTYFQQVAGISLEHPALEITLGLERLAMYILNVDDYRDIPWNKDVTYGEMFEKHEYWQSLHDFETSKIEDLKKLYSIYQDQIEDQLEKENYWAGYDYLLKLSHVFNLLDSRGVISISDRTAKFGQMGVYSKRIGQMWLEEREKLGYPLLNKQFTVENDLKLTKLDTKHLNNKNQYILEIGLEEIPAEYLMNWVEKIESEIKTEDFLHSKGLDFKFANLHFTSRRMVLHVVEPKELKDEIVNIKGPNFNICYDTNGNPSNALNGFLKKYSASIEDIKIIEEDGKSTVNLEITNVRELDSIINKFIQAIFKLAPAQKFMRWDHTKKSFIRPIRWIISFLNDKKIKVELPKQFVSDQISISADNFTYTPRYSDPQKVLIQSASDYFEFIKKYNIVLDQNKRREIIKENAVVNEDKYSFSPDIDKYIEINTYMTESPHVGFVELDSKFKILPRELVTSVLEKHQRYLIRWDKTDSSKIEYGVCANLYRANQDVIYGNKKVVNARLEDALFYFNKDQKTKLRDLREALTNINFHPKLGSYADKVRRLRGITEYVYKDILKQEIGGNLNEAFNLLKNDKATHLVSEFSKLEGVVGMNYALSQGYSKEVSSILSEHYLPTSDTSRLPSTVDSKYLSLLDKLDNIVALSSVGELPKGSNDPYEIRKIVYNLIRLIKEAKINLDFNKLFDYNFSLLNLNTNSDHNIKKEIADFINQRIYQLFRSQTENDRLAKGIAFSNSYNFYMKFVLFDELSKLIKDSTKSDLIFDTFKRISNILRTNDTPLKNSLNEKLLETESEKRLNNFVKNNLDSYLTGKTILELAEILEVFFKETMVNVENEVVRSNRLLLLSSLNVIVRTVFSEEEYYIPSNKNGKN